MRLKRFNLIMLLALLVTIGGVYASWSYSQGEIATVDIEKKVEMGNVVTSSPKGKITAQDNLVLTIENKGGFKTELKISGNMVLTFTPSAGADDTASDGIVFQISIVQDFGNYSDDNNIEAKSIFITHAAHALNEGSPSLTYTITAQQLMEHLQMNEFYLPTKDDFDNFSNSLTGHKIMIYISEYVAPAQPQE